MINEIYILFNEKNPLVHAVLREENVLDGTIIMDFVEVARKTDFKVHAVIIQDKQVVFKKMGNFVAVVIADELDDKNVVEHYAERVLKLFSAKYGHNLENWDGNINYFREFVKFIKKLVLTPKGALKIVF